MKFILAGPNAGKNLNLVGHGIHFVNGEWEYSSMEGKDDGGKFEGLKSLLATFYNAHPEGSPELEDAQSEWEANEALRAAAKQNPPAPVVKTIDQMNADELKAYAKSEFGADIVGIRTELYTQVLALEKGV